MRLAVFPSAVLLAWRGEISVYRAAFGLGGIGLTIVTLLGDAVVEVTGARGGAVAWACWLIVSGGEVLFAWVAALATWRAARRGRPDGRRYRTIPVGLALVFVGTQLALMIGWTGWTAGAALGMTPEPAAVGLNWLIRSATGK